MGMDIYSEDGFLLPFTDFLKLIEPVHLEGIKTDAIWLFRKRTGDRRYGMPMKDAIQAIEAANTVEAVCEALMGMLEPQNDRIEEGSHEMELICCISKVILPISPVNGLRFDNPRLSGFDVPIGELVLKFHYSDCFETRMTPSGEALARTLGRDKIDPNKWTLLSV